jgi:hypothetical protein
LRSAATKALAVTRASAVSVVPQFQPATRHPTIIDWQIDRENYSVMSDGSAGAVLDPFFGAGTTGLVADRLQRDCIGIELNPDYVSMARGHIHRDAPLLSTLEAAE